MMMTNVRNKLDVCVDFEHRHVHVSNLIDANKSSTKIIKKKDHLHCRLTFPELFVLHGVLEAGKGGLDSPHSPFRRLTHTCGISLHCITRGNMVMPKISCNAMRDPRVRVHVRTKPRASSGDNIRGRPRQLYFRMMKPSCRSAKGEYSRNTGVNLLAR